jgi:hypothetical protein
VRQKRLYSSNCFPRGAFQGLSSGLRVNDNRLEVGQAALKVFSHHGVATDKDHEKLEKKRRLAVHGPGHDGLGTFGLQRELVGIGATEWSIRRVWLKR